MWDFDTIVQTISPEAQYHQNRYAKCLDSFISENTRWLDLGAGTQIHGGWTEASESTLAKRTGKLIGCDLIPNHLRKNEHLTHGVAGDAYRLPFDDRSFDLVTANMVLEHLEQPNRAFTEVSRVLTPGGHLVFVTPNRLHPVVAIARSLASSTIRQKLASWSEGRTSEHIFRTYYRANSTDEIIALTQGDNWKIREISTFFSYPIFRHPAPVTLVEAFLIRSFQTLGLDQFGSNLIGVLQRI